jgi:hypothetical protein
LLATSGAVMGASAMEARHWLTTSRTVSTVVSL